MNNAQFRGAVLAKRATGLLPLCCPCNIWAMGAVAPVAPAPLFLLFPVVSPFVQREYVI